MAGSRNWTLVGIFALLIHWPAWAQTPAGGVAYKSEIDELLTIESVSVLPFSDNVQGIYARPLEAHFNDILAKMHRWDVRPVNSVGPVLSPEDLEDDSEKAKLMAGGITADAFFAARVSKGPNGVTIVLSLFLTKDSKLLAKATLKDAKRFDVADLKNQMESLLAKIVAQIPYQGRILSRDGQRLTVNVGKKDGVQVGQIISVIQIIAVTRHPKFNFIVSSEKEIIGRVKILKVDDTLSFGSLITEKEKGAVRKNAKIAGLDFVTYPESNLLSDASGGKDLTDRDDSKVSFGDNPTAWLPTRTPTFGQVGARLGNTLYNSSMNLTATGGSLSSQTFFAPSVAIDGEIWITQALSAHAGFKQGIIPIKNPRAGAGPPDLNQSLTQYELLFGYNFRFAATVWGPSLEALIGYFNYRLYIDDSTPPAYTTMTYNGLKFGAKGFFPVTDDGKWGAGAEMFMVFNPKMSETPVTSGATAKNSINMFGLFGTYKLTENTKILGKLDLEQYTTSFTGFGSRSATERATSSSQRHTTFSAGLYYLF
jgi:hypothetical protein